MCKCIKELDRNLSHLEIELVNNNELHLDFYGCRCGAFNEVIKINFCPICGEEFN